jgi:hypothetical protein
MIIKCTGSLQLDENNNFFFNITVTRYFLKHILDKGSFAFYSLSKIMLKEFKNCLMF